MPLPIVAELGKLPSRKTIVPVQLEGAAVAVNVTVCPKFDGFGFEETATDTLDVIICVSTEELLTS
jgi:hypothetical protein